MTTTAYKVFTHDLRPAVQGGDPVWTGELPHELPQVVVDESRDECGAGWNACAEPEIALRIAGLWPDGRPSRLYRVETEHPVVARGNKLRAASWRILEELDAEQAIRALSAQWFGEHSERMTIEQLAWQRALARALRDEAMTEQILRAALISRGLSTWQLKRFDSVQDAWDAWDAWNAWDAWTACDAWNAWTACDAWNAWTACGAWDVGDVWNAWTACDAWDAWNVRSARTRDALDAGNALCVCYAALRGWIKQPPDAGAAGLRDAYEHGLELALPTGTNELGWVV